MERSELAALADDYGYAYDSLWRRHGPGPDGSADYRGGPLLHPAFLLDVISVPPHRRKFSEQDFLDALVVIRAMRVSLDHVEGQIMNKARQRGTTFQRIANALGLKSRQAAEQRCLKLQTSYSHEERQHLDRRRSQRFGLSGPRSGTNVQWAMMRFPRFDDDRHEDERLRRDRARVEQTE